MGSWCIEIGEFEKKVRGFTYWKFKNLIKKIHARVGKI